MPKPFTHVRGALSVIAPSVLTAILGTTGCTTTIETTNEPLAAGATTMLNPANQPFDHLTSSNPDVIRVGSPNSPTEVVAGAPGTATITAYDASNNVIGKSDYPVAATSVIGLDPGVTTTGLAVIVGEALPIHATTIGTDGTTLVGDGAIHFAYDGALAADTTARARCSGDCGGFEATAPGDGRVVMTAAYSTATTVVSLHAVTSIDAFTIAQSSVDAKVGKAVTIPITIKAGGAPVWTAAVACTADSNKAAAIVGPYGSVTPATSISVVATVAGATKITCTAGAITQSFTINAT